MGYLKDKIINKTITLPLSVAACKQREHPHDVAAVI